MSAGPRAHDTALAGIRTILARCSPASRLAATRRPACGLRPGPRLRAARAGPLSPARSMPVAGVGRREHGWLKGRCPVEEEAWMSPEIRIQEAS
jgi:hypothetical protein